MCSLKLKRCGCRANIKKGEANFYDTTIMAHGRLSWLLCQCFGEHTSDCDYGLMDFGGGDLML